MGFDPVTLGIIGAVASGAGTALNGIAQGNAAAYQAQIAANNAKIANQNAAYAAEAGEAKEEAQSMKGAGRIGAIKAAMAANGVDVNTGSDKDVSTSAREEERLDTLNVANKTALEVYGYRTQQTGFEAEAKLYGAEAEEAPIAGIIGGAGGILGSISSTNLLGALGGGAASGAVNTATDAADMSPTLEGQLLY